MYNRFHTPTLFLLALVAAPLAASTSRAAPARSRQVILISCDGMRPDAIVALGAEKAPNLHRMMAEGAFTLNARTDADLTVTLPNHTAMITGRGVKGEAGHAWTSNTTPRPDQTLHRNKGAYLRSMFDVAHDHGLRTALFASKGKFVLYDRSYDERNGADDAFGDDDGKDKIDTYEFVQDSAELVTAFLKANDEKPFQLAMLHLRDPDSAGHSRGWDLAAGSHYMQAVMRVDSLIGRILTAIESDPARKGKTHLIVTADHGGRLSTKTHVKSDEQLNYTIPFLVWGPGVAAGADLYAINPTTRSDPGTAAPAYDSGSLPPVRNGDAGNLALDLLGLPAIGGSTINAKQDLGTAALPTSSTGG